MANKTLVDILRDIVGSNGDIVTASDGIYYDLIKRPNVKVGDILSSGITVDGGLLKAIEDARSTINSVKETMYGDDPINGSTGTTVEHINQAKTDIDAKSENVDTKHIDFNTKYADFTSGDTDNPAKYETFESQYNLAAQEFDKIQAIGNDLNFKNIDGTDRTGDESGKSLIKEVTDNLLKGNSSEVVKVGKDLMLGSDSKIVNVGDALLNGEPVDVVYKDMTNTDYSNILNAKANAESALSSKNDALSSKEKSNEWAEKDAGVEISGTTGHYSAKSYAHDSEVSATASEASRVASESAKNASEAARDQLTTLTTSASTLTPGSDATSSYNSGNGVLTLGIPQGDKGDKGDPFRINAVGAFADKANSNNQPRGFTFLSTNGYGPQAEEVTDTNFDGDISLDADSTITWDGSLTVGYKYNYIVTVKDGTKGSVELLEDTVSLGVVTGNTIIEVEHINAKDDLHFTSDSDFDGTINISIKRIRTQSTSVFFKSSDTDGDYWSQAAPFGKGDKGNTGLGIASLSFFSTTSDNGNPGEVDGIDTYRIIYTDGTLSDFSVANGVNLSDADIKTGYENNDDTNAFTDDFKTKLDGIAESANNYSLPDDVTKNDVNNTFTITQQATITTDDDGSFDMAVTNNFKCTVGDDLTLDFTNLASGRGGVILFNNSDAHTISKADKVICDSDCLSTLSDGGKFLLSYITDGTDVFMTYSKALS